jgi:hypothetical protein
MISALAAVLFGEAIAHGRKAKEAAEKGTAIELNLLLVVRQAAPTGQLWLKTVRRQTGKRNGGRIRKSVFLCEAAVGAGHDRHSVV